MTPQLKSPILSHSLFRRRWFKVTTVIVAVVLAVVVLVALVVFLMWWNSPEKALLDATDYAAKTPGSYLLSSGDGTILSVTLSDNKYAAEGYIKGIPIDAIYFGGDFYVRSSDPGKIYDMLMGADGKPLPPVIQSVLPTITNQWVDINLGDITLQSKGIQSMQCILQEKESVAHDPADRRQWGSLYLSNRFMNIKTTKQNNATSYDISINKNTRTAFFNALTKTSFYQSLTDCSKGSDVLENISTGSSVAKVILSDQHTLQMMTITEKGEKPITVTVNYKNVPQINIPTSVVSSNDLIIRYLQSIGSPITSF